MTEEEKSFADILKEKLTEFGDQMVDKYVEMREISEEDRPDIDPMLIPIVMIIIGIVLFALLLGGGRKDNDNSKKTNQMLDRMIKLRMSEMMDDY